MILDPEKILRLGKDLVRGGNNYSTSSNYNGLVIGDRKVFKEASRITGKILREKTRIILEFPGRENIHCFDNKVFRAEYADLNVSYEGVKMKMPILVIKLSRSVVIPDSEIAQKQYTRNLFQSIFILQKSIVEVLENQGRKLYCISDLQMNDQGILKGFVRDPKVIRECLIKYGVNVVMSSSQLGTILIAQFGESYFADNKSLYPGLVGMVHKYDLKRKIDFFGKNITKEHIIKEQGKDGYRLHLLAKMDEESNREFLSRSMGVVLSAFINNNFLKDKK